MVIMKVKHGKCNHDIAHNFEGNLYVGRLTEKETLDMSKNHLKSKENLHIKAK